MDADKRGWREDAGKHLENPRPIDVPGSAGVPPAEEEEESRGGWMAGEMAGILPASGTATGPP